VFTVLLWWAMERVLAADARGSTGAALASGLLWGLAILTRETVLYFLPFAALWLAWRRAGGARRAAALLAVSAFVVLPWTLRNWFVFDAFVPVSTSGALNLWQGNTRLSRQEVYEEYWAVRGRIPKYEHARRRAIEAILERQPLWILEKLRDEVPAFWAAHGQPIVHLERGAYGTVARSRAYAAVATVLLPYLAVLVLFVAGVATLPRGRAPLLLLAFLAFYVLLHVVAHGYPRYRLPAMPAVFLVAAHGWAAWRGREPVDRGHRLAAAAAALVLALGVGPSLVAWATRPWPPPWFADGGVEGSQETPTPADAPQAER
jgi:4-amino-4-deoxy-L-arabinose transferase-like glycosyltransferase